MYRAITLRVLEEAIALEDVEHISALLERTRIRLERADGSNRVLVDERDVTQQIRSARVTRSVSTVSSHQPVRNVLVREQRRMAKQGGVVLEGRDIGTVVLPRADLKVYMVANVTERTIRRKRELEVAGALVDRRALEEEIVERDRKDSTRKSSPLRRAEDALELDTSHMTIEEQVQFVVDKAREIIERRAT